jgi:hypothetical protein
MKKHIPKIIITLLCGLLMAGIVYAANTFPTSLNNWSSGDIIESDWANALEDKIGVDDSTVTSSIDYLIKHASSSLGSIESISESEGMIIYWDGEVWRGLATGTEGYVLKTTSTSPYIAYESETDPIWNASSSNYLLNTGDTATGEYNFGSNDLFISDDDNKIVIGSDNTSTISSAKFKMVSENSYNSDFGNVLYHQSVDGWPVYFLANATGTEDSPAALSIGDTVGEISFLGYEDGSSDFGEAASIYSKVDDIVAGYVMGDLYLDPHAGDVYIPELDDLYLQNITSCDSIDTDSEGKLICGTDADTTYSAGGTLLDLTSEVFSINEGTLTDTKLCLYSSGTGLVCDTTDNSTNWDTAYSWGDHSTEDYATTGQLHDAVTLDTTSYDYLSLSTQQITLGQIDISDDTNLEAGRSLTLSGDSVAADSELYTDTFSITVRNATATLDVAKHILPNAITITKVICEGDGGTGDIQLDEEGTDIMTSALTCANGSKASTTAFNNSGIASETWINLDIDSLSSAENLFITVLYTIDD